MKKSNIFFIFTMITTFFSYSMLPFCSHSHAEKIMTDLTTMTLFHACYTLQQMDDESRAYLFANCSEKQKEQWGFLFLPSEQLLADIVWRDWCQADELAFARYCTRPLEMVVDTLSGPQKEDENSFCGEFLIHANKTNFTFQEPWKIVGYANRDQFARQIVFLEANADEKFALECRDQLAKRIIFLQDNAQQKFVLKCYDTNQIEEAICEDLGSFIGGSVGVPMHKVQMMVGGELLKCIDNGTSLATLHTQVPGKELCKWFEVHENGIVLKGGLVSEKHLNSLVRSDDLCDIIALDIFLNNADRHLENCFEENNRYYAIDMGDIFRDAQRFVNRESSFTFATYTQLSVYLFEKTTLASDAYNFLKQLKKENLTGAQIKALQRVAYTLQKLLSIYPAEKLLALWLLKAQAIDHIYKNYKKNYLKIMLHFNMYWSRRVVQTINELVA